MQVPAPPIDSPHGAGDPWPDAAVLAALAEGRREGFRHLVDRYRRPLFGYLLSQVHRPDVAEDLLQEVLLRVFRAGVAGGYAGQSSVRTWVFVIARNVACDFWRQDQRAERLRAAFAQAETPEALAGIDPLRQVVAAEERFLVARALAGLPAEQREAAQLKFFAGLSASEIAEVTGVGLPAAKARLRYALQKLARTLAPLSAEEA